MNDDNRKGEVHSLHFTMFVVRFYGGFAVLAFSFSFQHNIKIWGSTVMSFLHIVYVALFFHFGYVIIFLYNAPSSLYGF